MFVQNKPEENQILVKNWPLPDTTRRLKVRKNSTDGSELERRPKMWELLSFTWACLSSLPTNTEIDHLLVIDGA